MSRGMIRLSVLGGVIMLIAGCGGSSSGGGSGGGGDNSTNVTFTITGTPTAVATQIGSGSFTATTLSNNKLTLSLPSGTTNFAVAYICPPITLETSPLFQLNEEIVIEASTLDGSSFSETTCGGSASSSKSSSNAFGTLTGSVDASAITGRKFSSIYAQGSTYWSEGSLSFSPGSFSIPAPVGTDRMEIFVYDWSNLLAMKNFSSVTVPGALNGGNAVVFGAADLTTAEPITYNNVPSGFAAPTTGVDYYMGNYSFGIADTATTTYPAVPAGAMESGDYYYFEASAKGSNPGTTNGYEEVTVKTTSAAGGPVSLTFPSAWTYAGPAAATWPSFNLANTGFTDAADVSDDVGISWNPSSSAENAIVVAASGNYLGGSTTMVIPDLTGLSGFIAAPASNSDVNWEASVGQSNYPCCQQSFPLNGTVKIVNNGGTYTAP